MRQTMKITLTLILLLGCICRVGFAQEGDNLPRLKQASFVSSFSPTEWMIRATGIGEGKKKEREMQALDDARRGAVYFVLYQGTDPLLTTDEEKKRMAALEQNFFALPNVMKYLAWESEEPTSRVKTADGKQLKIEKTFRVNVGAIRDDLVSRGVLMATVDLTVELGMPQIMVLPEVPKGENPLEALGSRPELKQAARAIESYLTARRYEVIVPEQQDFLNNYGETLQLIKDESEDLSYKLALAVGSDVYITYSVSLDHRSVGSSQSKKASVAVRAFETTTARLLGSETGYSEDRPSPDEVVTEEAIHDAIDKVLARVNAYWKEDLQRGVQYKIVCRLTGNFDRAQLENIQDTLADVIAKASNRSKENIASDRAMDFLVWTKPKTYANARDLYKVIREGFAANMRGAALERQQLNRKLILLQVVNQ